MDRASKQELLRFFQHYPYIFLGAFGSLEQKYAAIGILLSAISKGEWETSSADFEPLRQEGAIAARAFERELNAYHRELLQLEKYVRWEKRTFGLFGRFVSRPTVRGEPIEPLPVSFTKQRKGAILEGLYTLADGEYIYLKIETGAHVTIIPTRSFFDHLVRTYEKKGTHPHHPAITR